MRPGEMTVEQILAADLGARAPGLDDTEARVRDGAEFVLDGDAGAEAVWGDADSPAWAKGEPLMLVGPTGIGKTTAMQQLAFRGHGVLDDAVLLGMPIETTDGRGFYIAADRPKQAARSARRMVGERHRAALASHMRFWEGPLPFDLGKCARGSLVELVAAEPEVSRVYVDSLKDVAVALSADEVGGRVNGEFQELIAAGYELVVNHHQRKASGDNRRPNKIDDVYGSAWLTAGCGSVLLLWGEAGDPLVQLTHLKQPAGEVGPLRLICDHEAGTLALHEQMGLVEMAAAASGDGLTVRSAAAQLFGIAEPDRNQIEKARGRIKTLVAKGTLTEAGGGSEKHYRPAGAA